MLWIKSFKVFFWKKGFAPCKQDKAHFVDILLKCLKFWIPFFSKPNLLTHGKITKSCRGFESCLLWRSWTPSRITTTRKFLYLWKNLQTITHIYYSIAKSQIYKALNSKFNKYYWPQLIQNWTGFAKKKSIFFT